MHTVKVLFGFNHDSTSRAIVARLETYDCKVDASFRFTKLTIRDYIEKNNDLDYIFLKEYLDGGEKYGAVEISDLADTCRAKFIVVVRSANKGREAMKILYCAGILDCVFAEGRAGADPKNLADLAMHGRTRLDARRYYRIDAPMPDYGVLSFEDYTDCYNFLMGRDVPGQMISRFIDLSKYLSPKQLSKFIDNIPREDLEDLMAFEEFYSIHNKLVAQGVASRRFKKPKNLLKAVQGDTLAGSVEEVAKPADGGYTGYPQNNGYVQPPAMDASSMRSEHMPSGSDVMPGANVARPVQEAVPVHHMSLSESVYQDNPIPHVDPKPAGFEPTNPIQSASSTNQQSRRLSEMSLDEMLRVYS